MLSSTSSATKRHNSDKTQKRRSDPPSLKHSISAAVSSKKNEDDVDNLDSARLSTVEKEVFDTALDPERVTRKQSKLIWASCAGFSELEFTHGGDLSRKALNADLKVRDLLEKIQEKKLKNKLIFKFLGRENIKLSEFINALPELLEGNKCYEILESLTINDHLIKGSFAKNMLLDYFKITRRLNVINSFFQELIKSQKGSFSLWPIIYREVLPKAATGIAAAAAKGVGQGFLSDYFLPIIFISSSVLGLRFKSQAKKIEQKVKQFKEKYAFLNQLLNLCYVVGLIENKGGEFVARPELKEVDCICSRVWDEVMQKFALSSFKYFDQNKLLRFQLTMKISLIKYILRWREEEMSLRNQGLNVEEEFKFDNKLAAIIVEKFGDLIASTMSDMGRFKGIFRSRYDIKQVLATSAFDKAVMEAHAVTIRNESKKNISEIEERNADIKRTSRADAQTMVVAESLVYEQLISNFGIFKKEPVQNIYRPDEDGSITEAKDKILSDIMECISKKLSEMEGTKSRYKAPFWISVLAGYLKGEAFAQVNKNLRKLSFLSPMLAFMGSAVYVINNFLKKLTDILDNEYFKFTKEYDAYKSFLKFLHTNKMLHITYTTDSKGASKVESVEVTKSFKLINRILASTWAEISEDKINPQEWIDKNYSAKDQAFISLRLLNGMSFILKDSVPALSKFRMPEKFIKVIAKRFAEEIKGVSSTKFKDKILKFTLKTAITSGLHAKDIPNWISDELKKNGKILEDFYVPIVKINSSPRDLDPKINKTAIEFIEKLKRKSSQIKAEEGQTSQDGQASEIQRNPKTDDSTQEINDRTLAGIKIQKLLRGRSFIAGGYNQVTSGTSLTQQNLPLVKPSVRQLEDGIARTITKRELFQDVFNRGKDVVGSSKPIRESLSLQPEVNKI